MYYFMQPRIRLFLAGAYFLEFDELLNTLGCIAFLLSVLIVVFECVDFKRSPELRPRFLVGIVELCLEYFQ